MVQPSSWMYEWVLIKNYMLEKLNSHGATSLLDVYMGLSTIENYMLDKLNSQGATLLLIRCMNGYHQKSHA